MTTRGERDDNPGDIDISNTKWQGKVTPSIDKRFETFSTPEYGIRALAVLLHTYASEGFNTIRSIITKYAPGIENDTASYISAVSKFIGVGEDETLNLAEYTIMYKLVCAIIEHENGENIYTDTQISEALAMTGFYTSPSVEPASA